jgi:hypothetical protein
MDTKMNNLPDPAKTKPISRTSKRTTLDARRITAHMPGSLQTPRKSLGLPGRKPVKFPFS